LSLHRRTPFYKISQDNQLVIRPRHLTISVILSNPVLLVKDSECPR
jgi:hypothetical protein